MGTSQPTKENVLLFSGAPGSRASLGSIPQLHHNIVWHWITSRNHHKSHIWPENIFSSSCYTKPKIFAFPKQSISFGKWVNGLREQGIIITLCLIRTLSSDGTLETWQNGTYRDVRQIRKEGIIYPEFSLPQQTSLFVFQSFWSKTENCPGFQQSILYKHLMVFNNQLFYLTSLSPKSYFLWSLTKEKLQSHVAGNEH